MERGFELFETAHLNGNKLGLSVPGLKLLTYHASREVVSFFSHYSSYMTYIFHELDLSILISAHGD